MKIEVTVKAPWNIGGNIKSFNVGTVLTVGEDLSERVAKDMLKVGHAKPCGKEDIVPENKAMNPVEEDKSLDLTEVDLEDLDRTGLIAFAEDNKIEIKKSLGVYRLREAIGAALEVTNE